MDIFGRPMASHRSTLPPRSQIFLGRLLCSGTDYLPLDPGRSDNYFLRLFSANCRVSAAQRRTLAFCYTNAHVYRTVLSRFINSTANALHAFRENREFQFRCEMTVRSDPSSSSPQAVTLTRCLEGAPGCFERVAPPRSGRAALRPRCFENTS